MDEQTPKRIRSFVNKHLTRGEQAEIQAQFSSSFRPDCQVLWTGLTRETSQAWANAENLQTLTTAMGPLMNTDDPACPRSRMNDKQWTRYIHGASALFALKISRGNTVTVLTQPPPERFHPSGLTSFQGIEEPIIKGRLGNRPVRRIKVAHPTVSGAGGRSYELWPRDSSATWISTFGLSTIQITWRAVSTKKVDLICKAVTGTEDQPAGVHVAAPQTVVQQKFKAKRSALQVKHDKQTRKFEQTLEDKLRGQQRQHRREMQVLREEQARERKSLLSKKARKKLKKRHEKHLKQASRVFSEAQAKLLAKGQAERAALEENHKAAVLQLEQEQKTQKGRGDTLEPAASKAKSKPSIPPKQSSGQKKEPHVLLVDMVLVCFVATFYFGRGIYYQ
ncbi:hypothetical protein LIA77_02999 [Sarocladium implicatum]|nr:hypothetical protein LIA77_02999 [Sarocladium implicatum]